MVAVPLHTAFKNGCSMRIFGKAWMSFLSCSTNSAEVAMVNILLVLDSWYGNVGVMELWSDGWPSTPLLHHSITPMFFLFSRLTKYSQPRMGKRWSAL